MVNKTLFQGKISASKKPANTVNEAGGLAYSKTDKQALATLVCVGTFNGAYYASGKEILDKIKELSLNMDDKFIAQLAIYGRKSSFMKDTPAFLVAVLAARRSEYFDTVFDKVIDNGKMLRNFFIIGRSGEAGKVINMSSGRVRKAMQRWFNKSSEWIFKQSIGSPSLGNILKMARPKPDSQEKASLFAYLLGSAREVIEGTEYFVVKDRNGHILYKNAYYDLPKIVKDLEDFKKNHLNPEFSGEIPSVDFRLLDSVLNKEELKTLWERQLTGGWHSIRMNLNNFKKYGVLDNPTNVKTIAQRLRDKEEIAKSKVFPYQLLNTFVNAEVPHEISEALQDALDVSVDNVPSMSNGFVCVDTSGSMQSSITGNSSVPSKVKCVQVAGLVASSILRKNPNSEIIPFDTAVRMVKLNPRDSVMTNSVRLSLNGGGTDISSPIHYLNINNKVGDYIIIVSDNESWAGFNGTYGRTGTMEEWLKFKKRNPNAKLICIDLQPYTTSQVSPDKDILMVAGFSDEVYNVIENFLSEKSEDFWIKEIEKTII